MLNINVSNIVMALLILGLTSCTPRENTNSKIKLPIAYTHALHDQLSPYEVYLDSFKVENATDTLLVQRKSRIFYCGTGALEYYKELKEKRLHQYFEEYGDLVQHPTFIEKMESNNKAKILWVNRGNEGELMQLEDNNLHINNALEKQLFKEKLFIQITENPISMNSVEIYTIITNPLINKTTRITRNITKKNGNWKMKQTKSESW